MTTATPQVGRANLVDALLCLAIIGALLFAFTEPLVAMVTLWDVSPMYSYGYAVPLVSGYLLWVSRSRLSNARLKPARLIGVLVLAGAVAMAIASQASGIQVLGQLAFLVAIVGIVLTLAGVAHLRLAAPAIAYLLLMVPIWDGFTEPLHWPFQNQSASLSMSMLRFVGVPVYRDGTFLSLPGITLEVARACSGVNYLIAVIALGLPLAYLYLDRMWRRVALLVFALVVAAFANSLRVTLIGILAYLDIGSPLHGPFHILHGLFVAGVGYAALFGGLHVLGRRRSPVIAGPAGAAPPLLVPRIPRLEAVAVATLLLAFGMGAFTKQVEAVELPANLSSFPGTLESWQWNRLVSAPSRPEWPGADAELKRQYQLPSGATADIYVGYFATQQQERELANSKADDLHRRSRQQTLAADPKGLILNAVKLVDPEGEALFWYELDGPETSALRTRFWTLRNAVLRGRTNGAVVMVASPSALGGAAGTAEELQTLAIRTRQELAALLAKAQPARGKPRG
jgi:EpsI family protein